MLFSFRDSRWSLRDAGDAGGIAPGPEQLTELMQRFAGRGPAVGPASGPRLTERTDEFAPPATLHRA
jgi:hypothetical protein